MCLEECTQCCRIKEASFFYKPKLTTSTLISIQWTLWYHHAGFLDILVTIKDTHDY